MIQSLIKIYKVTDITQFVNMATIATLEQYLEGESPELRAHANKFYDLGRLVASAESNKSVAYRKIFQAIANHLSVCYYGNVTQSTVNVEIDYGDGKFFLTLNETLTYAKKVHDIVTPAFDYLFNTFQDRGLINKQLTKLFGAYEIGLVRDLTIYLEIRRRQKLATAARWN